MMPASFFFPIPASPSSRPSCAAASRSSSESISKSRWRRWARARPIPGTDSSSARGSASPRNRSSIGRCPVMMRVRSEVARRSPTPTTARKPSSPCACQISASDLGSRRILTATRRYASTRNGFARCASRRSATSSKRRAISVFSISLALQIRTEVLPEPVPRKGRHSVQSAGLLEQMARPGNYLESVLGLTRKLSHGFAVEVQDDGIVAAHDEQGGCEHPLKRVARQIRPSPARHYCLHDFRACRRRNQCRRGARACSKVPEPQFLQARLPANPIRNPNQTMAQHRDIETQLCRLVIDGFFLLGQQIRQDRSDCTPVEDFRNVAVPGAVPAAPAAVGEQYEARGARWHRNVGTEL